jgi:hypothetical protein
MGPFNSPVTPALPDERGMFESFELYQKQSCYSNSVNLLEKIRCDEVWGEQYLGVIPKTLGAYLVLISLAVGVVIIAVIILKRKRTKS